MTTATSVVSAIAGSARAPCPGSRNSCATACASVLLPPLPKVNSRPPARKEPASAAAQATSRSAYSTAIRCRSATISAAFSAVARRTSSSTAVTSPPPLPSR